MRNIKNFRSATGIGVAILGLTWASPSHAYIDPGTGSIILQSILAGVAVAAGLLRTFWFRLKTYFARQDGPGHDTGSGAASEYTQDADIPTDS